VRGHPVRECWQMGDSLRSCGLLASVAPRLHACRTTWEDFKSQGSQLGTPGAPCCRGRGGGGASFLGTHEGMPSTQVQHTFARHCAAHDSVHFYVQLAAVCNRSTVSVHQRIGKVLALRLSREYL